MRRAIIDRILIDQLNATKVQQAMRRDFLQELLTGYPYDCLVYAITKFDGAAFRAQVLSESSGVLCVDEIHLGHRVLMLAGDPISDNLIACVLVSSDDAAHMLRFLSNQKTHWFPPREDYRILNPTRKRDQLNPQSDA